jgi:hypothetical protein
MTLASIMQILTAVMGRPKEKPEKQVKKKRKAPRCLQEAFFLSTAFSLKTAVV